MAKYLLLEHYRGAPSAVNDVPMEKWTPEEISAVRAARRALERPGQLTI